MRLPPTPDDDTLSPRPSERSRGQALVETAILLPVLLILLLGAIDFGRAFFGWVNLHQAVRNGANYAATHAGLSYDPDRYEALIQSDLDAINCEPEDPLPTAVYTKSDGTPAADPVLGDYATLTLHCDFFPLTPLMDLVVGEPLEMRATAAFPVREGCISCPTPAPATPPPTPLQCYEVPNMVGMSVGGARAAWTSAGFDPDSFSPVGHDTETVESFTVSENDPLSNCDYPTFAIFSSSVSVTTLLDDEPCAAGEAVVPNVVGMALGDARTAWEGAGFEADQFTADGSDPDLLDQTRAVESQTTTPASTAGVTCVEQLTTTIEVLTGEPYPAPPPTPCKVPNMVQASRPDGEALWVSERFSAANFSPSKGNFTIRSQSLVGGTYVSCDASVTVSANP